MDTSKKILPTSTIERREHHTLIQIYNAPFHVVLKVSSRELGRKQRHNVALAILCAIESRLGTIIGGAVSESDAPYCNRMDRRAADISTRQDLDTEAQILGYRIRMRRLALRLSQKGLATLCGIERTHLSHIEQGHHEARPATLRKLEAALGPGLKCHNAKRWEPSAPPPSP
ncbi:MAG: helix-turn-helix transcriptional regulator [Deltaproteobacteria bacterium]|nr:helix-turn-helix transcriptional regulator [Deltaproteobacteria bacterium]